MLYAFVDCLIKLGSFFTIGYVYMYFCFILIDENVLRNLHIKNPKVNRLWTLGTSNTGMYRSQFYIPYLLGALVAK